LEDKFDAAAIHLSQKLLIEYQGVELNVINASDYTNVSSNHIAVTKNFLDKNPELIRKFLRATKKGLEYAVNNPEKAVEMYISFNPDAISKRNVSQELWNTFIKVHNYEMSIPNLDLYQDWKSSQDILYDVGLITSKVDVSKIYTNDFVPK
jgi:ABC-type nitrate/sulfonate/bicarbonate transport system substrate-binding protein